MKGLSIISLNTKLPRTILLRKYGTYCHVDEPMHRSQIEAIIQKQSEIIGSGKVKKLLLGISEIQIDEQGRLVNLSRDDDQMLAQVVNVFLDFSHDIVKGLLFEIDTDENENPEAEKPKPIQMPQADRKIGVSSEV